jgi:cyclin B
MSMSSLLQSRSEAAVSGNKKAAREVAVPPSPMPDIDTGDHSNPLAVSEYVNDIYSYYRRIEPKYRVNPGYMSTQVCRHKCWTC